MPSGTPFFAHAIAQARCFSPLMLCIARHAGSRTEPVIVFAVLASWARSGAIAHKITSAKTKTALRKMVGGVKFCIFSTFFGIPLGVFTTQSLALRLARL